MGCIVCKGPCDISICFTCFKKQRAARKKAGLPGDFCLVLASAPRAEPQAPKEQK